MPEWAVRISPSGQAAIGKKHLPTIDHFWPISAFYDWLKSTHSCLSTRAKIGQKKPLKPCCLTFIRCAEMTAFYCGGQLDQGRAAFRAQWIERSEIVALTSNQDSVEYIEARRLIASKLGSYRFVAYRVTG